VQATLRGAGLTADIAAIIMRSSVSSKLDGNEASSMIKLLEMLEDLDDVQSVHSNAEIPDDILASL
jgi:transcriptional/translational regulatory protein YebC/TACO1